MATATLKSGSLREQLIRLLADGHFHSGADLARSTGVSRTAVWKALNTLEEYGMELHRAPRKGYRVPAPLELLDAHRIEGGLKPANRQCLRRIEVLLRTESTNDRLLAVSDLPAGQSDFCFAEFQTSGRGRQGRTWIAPFGCSLCLSVSRLYPELPRQVSALTMAAAVAVVRALKAFGVTDAGVKWPNDLIFDRRKLGGILTEMRAEAAGPAYVVLGVGLNLGLSPAARQKITESLPEHGLQAAALSEALESGRMPGRNALAAALADELLSLLEEYPRTGFQGYAAEWREADVLFGQPVQVFAGETVYKGIARGIDGDGSLLLETPGQLLRFRTGEVSLRAGAWT